MMKRYINFIGLSINNFKWLRLAKIADVNNVLQVGVLLYRQIVHCMA